MDFTDKSIEHSLWRVLEHIMANLKSERLADVFRFISFYPSERCECHRHLRIEINYVKKGSCILHLDNDDVSFHEGDIMIITSGTNHWLEAGASNLTLMQLEFLPEILFNFNENSETGKDSFPSFSFLFSKENGLIKIVNNVSVMRTIERIISELEYEGPHYKYLVVMYYAELLIYLRRYMNDAFSPIYSNSTLRKAIAYIHHNYQLDINMTDVARYTSISERYLRKLFSRNLHLSPLDYLNKTRINKSIELLKNTEMSVKEVCFLCGFQSPQYFSRVFKQQIGVSPREMTR